MHSLADAWPTAEKTESFFGKIIFGNDGAPSPRWESRNIVAARVPYPMRLAWSPDHSIVKIRMHRACRSSILNALEGIKAYFAGDMQAIQQAGADLFGGAYYFSLLRNGELSPHSYGAAFTLDPCGNPPGRKFKECCIKTDIAEIFKKTGAKWGGDSVNNPACAEFSYIL